MRAGREKYRRNFGTHFPTFSPPEQGKRRGRTTPEGHTGYTFYGLRCEENSRISPYLTSGTVTELSAMLVDRMIYQTSKKESDMLTIYRKSLGIGLKF